jgi:hypothetical protein
VSRKKPSCISPAAITSAVFEKKMRYAIKGKSLLVLYGVRKTKRPAVASLNNYLIFLLKRFETACA